MLNKAVTLFMPGVLDENIVLDSFGFPDQEFGR